MMSRDKDIFSYKISTEATNTGSKRWREPLEKSRCLEMSRSSFTISNMGGLPSSYNSTPHSSVVRETNKELEINQFFLNSLSDSFLRDHCPATQRVLEGSISYGYLLEEGEKQFRKKPPKKCTNSFFFCDGADYL